MTFSNTAALLAVLVGGVLAKDRTECYTAMTTKNPPRYLETKYSTHYQPCTKTSTETKYTTTTPKVYKYDVRYSTSTVTNGYEGTSTSTIFTTMTTTSTSVSTSTSTSTSVVQAFQQSVVPAPAGFVPVQSSLPGSTFTNNTVVTPRSPDMLTKRASKKQKQYPKLVQCNVYTPNKQCVIKHKTITKTKPASYPTTINTKTTKVITTTVCPKAKITVKTTKTRTSTVPSLVISTASATTTSTSIVGTTTIFEVCLSSANYANLATGRPISNLEALPEDRQSLEAVTVRENAYQCCNAAMLARGNLGDLVRSPQVFLFRTDIRRRVPGEGEELPEQDNGGICEIYGARECGTGQSANQWAANTVEDDPEDATDDAPLSTVGNAICGQVVPEPEREIIID